MSTEDTGAPSTRYIELSLFSQILMRMFDSWCCCYWIPDALNRVHIYFIEHCSLPTESASSLRVSEAFCISSINIQENVYSNIKVNICSLSWRLHLRNDKWNLPLCVLRRWFHDLLSGHTNTQFYLDISMGGNDMQVFSGSEDGNVFIWNLVEAKIICKIPHPMSGPGRLSFHA